MPAETFDILAELAPIAVTLIAVVGGAIVAGLGVWAIGIGATVGLKKFQSIVKKA